MASEMSVASVIPSIPQSIVPGTEFAPLLHEVMKRSNLVSEILANLDHKLGYVQIMRLGTPMAKGAVEKLMLPDDVLLWNVNNIGVLVGVATVLETEASIDLQATILAKMLLDEGIKQALNKVNQTSEQCKIVVRVFYSHPRKIVDL